MFDCCFGSLIGLYEMKFMGVTCRVCRFTMGATPGSGVKPSLRMKSVCVCRAPEFMSSVPL